MAYIHDRKKPEAGWLAEQGKIAEKAKEQGGRCELQVVAPVERLIEAAAGGNVGM
jgi:hypothetical protein